MYTYPYPPYGAVAPTFQQQQPAPAPQIVYAQPQLAPQQIAAAPAPTPVAPAMNPTPPPMIAPQQIVPAPQYIMQTEVQPQGQGAPPFAAPNQAPQQQISHLAQPPQAYGRETGYTPPPTCLLRLDPPILQGSPPPGVQRAPTPFQRAPSPGSSAKETVRPPPPEERVLGKAHRNGARVTNGTRTVHQPGGKISSEKRPTNCRHRADGKTKVPREETKEEGVRADEEDPSAATPVTNQTKATSRALPSLPSRSRTSGTSQPCARAPCRTSQLWKGSSLSYVFTPPKTSSARTPTVTSPTSPKAAASAPCSITPGRDAPSIHASSVTTKLEKP
jgi:hypothetical protein